MFARAYANILSLFGTSASSTQLEHRRGLLIFSNAQCSAWIRLGRRKSFGWTQTACTGQFGHSRHKYSRFGVDITLVCIVQICPTRNLKVQNIFRSDIYQLFFRLVLQQYSPSVTNVELQLMLRRESSRIAMWCWLNCSVVSMIIYPLCILFTRCFATI